MPELGPRLREKPSPWLNHQNIPPPRNIYEDASFIFAGDVLVDRPHDPFGVESESNRYDVTGPWRSLLRIILVTDVDITSVVVPCNLNSRVRVRTSDLT